ncbi:hypothetical protein V6N11_059549 [Hibiscus sabdariffa]|uniref:Uncharacterized protein n=1 Tax=Hibiscus sabdariffa TaxID=183260 RepID=A0ABR2NP23_9ROSI
MQSAGIPLVSGVEQLWADGRKTVSSTVTPESVMQGGPSSNVQPARTSSIEEPVRDGTGPTQGTQGCSTLLDVHRMVSPEVSTTQAFREPTNSANSSTDVLAHEHAAISGSQGDAAGIPTVVQSDIGTAADLSETTTGMASSVRHTSECDAVVDS